MIAAVGRALLVGVPITRWWWEAHPSDPAERLEAEQAAVRERVLPLAKRDLACDDVEVEVRSDIYAIGCGRSLHYVADGDGFRAVPVASPAPPECETRWTADDAGAVMARDVAAAIQARGHASVAWIPNDAFDIKGFAKLRYHERIDVRIEASGGPPGEMVTVPCLDPDAATGVKGADCKLPWSAVVEVAECR